jgi:WhiB family redox-sensing transcriptional regulator
MGYGETFKKVITPDGQQDANWREPPAPHTMTRNVTRGLSIATAEVKPPVTGPQPNGEVYGGDWRLTAACKGEDPELFYPEGRDAEKIRLTRAAKVICARCAVVSECGSDALGEASQYGIRGGLTEEERRNIKSRRRII